MAAHPFRFGALEWAAPSGAAWAETARRVEGHGYSTLQIIDHLGPRFAPVPALTAAAAATTSLRVATQVFANDFRHPVMLAKECATLDLLSDGRLELGLGAGWDVTEYDQVGIPFDRPGVRIDRFLEGLEILRRCFGPGAFSFTGKHYTVTDYEGLPKPVQRPAPKLLIGGGGKRMLGIAGREADIVSLNFDLGALGDRSRPVEPGPRFSTPDVAATGTAEMVDRKIGWARAGAGARFDDLEINISTFMTICTDDADTEAQRLAGQLGIRPEDVLELPFALLGTAEQMIDTLVERRERYGINYVTFPMPAIPDAYAKLAPVVERLAGT